MGQRLLKFLEGVREEMRRVSWPDRQELVGSALVVFVGVSLLVVYIGVCDFVLSKAARALLQQ